MWLGRVRCGSEGCGVAQIRVRCGSDCSRPGFESRLGTPGVGPLPSGCNKSGALRVKYINIV